MVLSACSTYFQKLLLENPCKHPTIILPADIIFTDLKTIIDFVYRGEIDVTESELQVSFLLFTSSHKRMSVNKKININTCHFAFHWTVDCVCLSIVDLISAIYFVKLNCLYFLSERTHIKVRNSLI